MKWEQASNIEGGVTIPNSWVRIEYYEAFNLLFRIENAIRVFVYVVLKDKLHDGWMSAALVSDDDMGTIASVARKRIGQARTFGYLGYPISNPLMHLTGGELARLMVSDAYWSHFKPYFHGSKEIIRNKLDEVGSIRNALAHFRPIRADDVDVVKQNSRHFLQGVEELLNQVLLQPDVVPTNTDEQWYRELSMVGSDHCHLAFSQSSDEKWIRIRMTFDCPVVRRRRPHSDYVEYTLLTVHSSSVLTKVTEVTKSICYLSESAGFPRMLEELEAKFSKTLSFVVSRAALDASQALFQEEFTNLLQTIEQETDLIRQDNLARGDLVRATSASASRNKDSEPGPGWTWRYSKIKTPVSESDPPEYWGDIEFYGFRDFVGAAGEYPWMPESVSDFPF